MKFSLNVPLNTSPEEALRLRQLQAVFAQACNALAPLVQQSRVWNRVALHHMAYKPLRAQFPQMGSQMACNAIYSVSRHSRLVYQGADSPFNLSRLGDKPLPLLRFHESCPVYFDRHTLSLKDGSLSMFTLDGRMRFQVALRDEDEANFREKKLREVVLVREGPDRFELRFEFTDKDDDEAVPAPATAALPTYMKVEETPLESS